LGAADPQVRTARLASQVAHMLGEPPRYWDAELSRQLPRRMAADNQAGGPSHVPESALQSAPAAEPANL